MLNNSDFRIIILIIPYLLSSGCSNPTDIDYSDYVYMAGTPVIKGYYVTTNEYPDGLGETIGEPAYVVKNINVFPNPFVEEYDEEIGYNNRFVTFTHLPSGNVTIIIVKGISESETNSSPQSVLGIPVFKSSVMVLKTIIKQDNSPFARWDFHNDELPLTGLYRAYIFGDEIPKNYFLDFSLTLLVKEPIRY